MDLISSYEDDDSCVDEPSQDRNGQNCSADNVVERISPESTCSAVDQKQSTECNYFGLTNSDESSADDDNEKWREELSKGKAVHGKRKHSSSDDESAEPKFWLGLDGKINWQDPSSLWNCNSSDLDTKKWNDSISTRTDTKRTDPLMQPNINQRLPKSCFVVHHKIAPLLHSGKVRNKPPSRQSCEMNGHQGPINRVQWCATNYSHLLLTACMDRTVKIWNVFSREKNCVQTLRHHDKAVKDAKWSSSGSHIISCSYDRSSCLMDVETGSCISRFRDDGFVTCVVYHPVDHHVFVSGSCNSMKAWDLRTAVKPIRTFCYKDNIGQVQDIVFLASGREFFTCTDLVTRDSADRNIMAWDFSKSVVLSNQIYQERFTCCRLKIHPDQLSFMAQSQGDYIAQFSTDRPYKMNKCKRYESHKVAGYNIGFDTSPDGKSLISASSDGIIPIYDIRTTRIMKKLIIGQHQIALDVTWHPVLSSTVAIVTWDGNIYVWC